MSIVGGLATLLFLWLIAWLLVRLSMALLAHAPGRLRLLAGKAPVERLVERFDARFPRSKRFLFARFDTGRFEGLPLTLVVIAAGYAAALFGGLVEEVVDAEEIAAVDGAVNRFLSPYRTEVVVAVFGWLTRLGDSATTVAVAAVATGFCWVNRAAGAVPGLWLALLGSQATTYAGKFALARSRPEFLTEITALSPSFPSAHATTAMALYGFIAYLIARDLRSARQRFEVLFWTVVVVAVVGFSRILLSVHHASDVAAGLLVGSFWLLAGMVVFERRRAAARALARRSGS